MNTFNQCVPFTIEHVFVPFPQSKNLSLKLWTFSCGQVGHLRCLSFTGYHPVWASRPDQGHRAAQAGGRQGQSWAGLGTRVRALDSPVRSPGCWMKNSYLESLMSELQCNKLFSLLTDTIVPSTNKVSFLLVVPWWLLMFWVPTVSLWTWRVWLSGWHKQNPL